MPTSSPEEVTQLLAAWGSGDQAALNQLMPLVYDELHQIAHRYLRRERADHTLQTTALVNEAYLKLVGEQNKDWQNRVHFFAVAANMMRHLLVDYARTRNRARRGGGAQQVPLDDALIVSHERATELLKLDDALQSLEKFDARKSRIAELRYFGGLSVEETAEVLRVSTTTILREWRLTKAWLHHEMSRGGNDEPGTMATD
jgi:RNA polymerase sigma factor (TIGR02999 family)